MKRPVLELKKLSVGYRGHALIEDISLSIDEGEIITLIGPNGAGKSTILKTITHQLKAVEGTVVLDGRALGEIKSEELAKKMAVLLTQRIKPELMTNRDVVETGRYPYTGRMGQLSRTDHRVAQMAMEIAEIAEIAEQSFAESSDGQKQRVLFARALCQSPDVLILDEPTSFLDIRHKLHLLQALRTLTRGQKLTVIMSLHEIDLAQKISDRVICVKGNRIFGVGTPKEMFTEENIRSLYDLEEGMYDPENGSLHFPKEKNLPLNAEMVEETGEQHRQRLQIRWGVAIGALFLLCMTLFAANVLIGNVELSPRALFLILTGRGEDATLLKILLMIRLPRVLMAGMLGGALALSGFLLQTFFENPIAGPFILGISSGAKLTVALVMIGSLKMMTSLSSWGLIGAAFFGSLLSTGFILLISRKVQHAATLLVAGMMIGYICSALTDFLLTFAEDGNIVSLRGWSMGSFSGMSWNNVQVAAVIVGLTFVLTCFLAKPIGAFQMGEGYAMSMGVNVRRFRVVLILLSSILSSCVTAFAGPISFVGIAIPYLTKQLLKTTKTVIVIPAVFLAGAAFCMGADLIARCAFSPTELNISTVTSMFGAPVVIFMLLKKKR